MLRLFVFRAAGFTNNIVSKSVYTKHGFYFNFQRNTVFLTIKAIPDNAQLIVKLDQQLQNVSQKDFRSEITDYKHFLR